MKDIGPLLKGHDFYQKCPDVIHIYLKKFKKIHLSFEALVDELNRAIEDPECKDRP